MFITVQYLPPPSPWTSLKDKDEFQQALLYPEKVTVIFHYSLPSRHSDVMEIENDSSSTNFNVF
jgi:hypothetical protein